MDGMGNAHGTVARGTHSGMTILSPRFVAMWLASSSTRLFLTRCRSRSVEGIVFVCLFVEMGLGWMRLVGALRCARVDD